MGCECINVDGLEIFSRFETLLGRESIASFSSRSGVADGTLRTFSKGAIPKAETLYTISDILGVSLNWLLTGKEHRTSSNNKNIQIPRHNLELSAGNGSIIDRTELVDHIPFTEEFFKNKLPYANVKNLIIFDAIGDSMLPTISSGDLVMIDRCKTQIADGLYAFTIDHMAFIKRIQMNPGVIIFKSDNSEIYESFERKLEDVGDLEIIGKVVWKGSLL